MPHFGLPPQPPAVICLMDPGFDVDDESALLVAAALQRRGWIRLKAVVATTRPSLRRARLAKGALVQLGLPEVPVAVGDDACPPDFEPKEERLEADFLAAEEQLEEDAKGLLRKTLEASEDGGVVFLVAAKMTDLAQLLEAEPQLCRRKLGRVVVMGGVEQTSAGPLLHQGQLQPNQVATNNRHDLPAATRVFKDLQQLGIPLVVVTRVASTAVPVDPGIFSHLAKTGHPVARHLRILEDSFLNDFWRDACAGRLGPGRDREWFVTTFCGSEPPLDTPDIRPFLKGRVLYDAVALVAGLEGPAEYFFEPLEVGNCRVVGLSRLCTGLRHPEELARFLQELAEEACQARDH